MNKTALLLSAALLAACGPKLNPRDQYLRGVNQRLAGDAHAYTDTLIALAHEAPESRAGRRARATLQSGSAMTSVAVIGILAAIAIPNFLKFSTRAKQSEAKTTLKMLYTAQKAYFAENGRYCRNFTECGVEVDPNARYLYFMGRQMVTGGGGSAEAEALFDRSGILLDALDLHPEVKKTTFLLVAVGNIDGDDDPDVWSINQDNALEHHADDTR